MQATGITSKTRFISHFNRSFLSSFPFKLRSFSENFEYILLYFTTFSRKVLAFIVQMHIFDLFLNESFPNEIPTKYQKSWSINEPAFFFVSKKEDLPLLR